VINSLKPGGGERFLVDLLQLLHEEFEFKVFCLYSKGDFASEIERLGVPIEVLDIPRKIRITGYVRVYRALRQGDFDIMHCHLLEGCWYGLPAGWLARVPVRIAHLQNCHWRLSFRGRLFDRLAFSFAGAAFGCSQAVLRFYQQRMWYPRSKCHLVYNGVVTKRFEVLPPKEQARKRLGLPQDAVVVTTVARLVPQKGHVYLIEAAKEVVSEFRNIRFLLVGEGGLRLELEQRVRNLNLAEHFLFLGQRTDVPEILAASDIFVLPSLWEGLPLVLVEAGLAGLPVVASRVDGIVEIVEDGRNGFLVPPGEPSALAGAIRVLAKDPYLREQMGNKGRAIAHERFAMERIARQVAGLYHQLLRAKGVKAQ